MDITNYIKGAIDNDQKSIDYLKSIKKGIYIILFTPDSTIYESGKKDFKFSNDQIVVKPGKFKNNLHYRFLGAKGYNDVWKYQDTEANVFSNCVKVYLISDMSHTISDYESSIEVHVNAMVKHLFEDAKVLKGGKEYYDVNDSADVAIHKINNIKHTISDEIAEDKKSYFKRLMYNL